MTVYVTIDTVGRPSSFFAGSGRSIVFRIHREIRLYSIEPTHSDDQR